MNILQTLIDLDNIDHITHAEQIKRTFDPAAGLELLRKMAAYYPETKDAALSVNRNSDPEKIRAAMIRVRDIIFDSVQ